MARYGLFVQKVLINPNQPFKDHRSGSLKVAECIVWSLNGCVFADRSVAVCLYWRQTCSVCTVSTPKYLAPEVLCTTIRRDPFHFDDDGCVHNSFQDTSVINASSPRTDVWSIGLVVLEYLLVGAVWIWFFTLIVVIIGRMISTTTQQLFNGHCPREPD